MTRGKYAVKAANRLATLDNELLAQKIAEVASLNQQLAALQKQLHDERVYRDALVLARARELTATEIAQVRDEAAHTEAALLAQMKDVAIKLEKYFHVSASYPRFWFDEILPVLRPDLTQTELSAHIHALIDAHRRDVTSTGGFGNRYTRRHAAENVERARSRSEHNDRAIDKVLQLEKETEGQFERVGLKFRRIDHGDNGEQET